MTPISVHNLSLLESEKLAPPAAVVVCIKHRRLSYSRCCRSRGLNPLVKALPVPFPWDAYTAVAVVRGACTSRVSSVPTRQTLTRCHCFSARNLDPFPPESVLAIPRVAFGTAAALGCTRHPVAKVVGTDAAGRSFLFTTCRHLSATNRNRLSLASSVSTARDAYWAADCRARGTDPLERRLFRHARRSPSVHNLPLHTCEESVPNRRTKAAQASHENGTGSAFTRGFRPLDLQQQLYERLRCFIQTTPVAGGARSSDSSNDRL